MYWTCFTLCFYRPVDAAREQIGNLWLETSKIARKAGHSQTAYSAILQAQDLNAPYVFVQSAKLLKQGEQTYKAIQDLDNALQSLIPSNFGKVNESSDLIIRGAASPLAKVSISRERKVFISSEYLWHYFCFYYIVGFFTKS